LPYQERNFAERSEGEAAPAHDPETKIAVSLVSPEKQEEDQQYNKGSRFKERDAKQALILQHVALPPGSNIVAVMLGPKRF
jgi:hypothetical protein